MAPISRIMQRRYDTAVQATLDFFDGNLSFNEVSLNDISELKGMFNRCVRQDQWDWFSVYTQFGQPPRDLMIRIVVDLKPLRQAINSGDSVETDRLKQALIKRNLLHFLHTYLRGVASHTCSPEAGWVYILSTREQPDILKVGMTTRTVFERVQEINSATGVLVPFAARRVFRVQNARHAEKRIHSRLDRYRIRSDREFFKLPFFKAVEIIEEFVESENLALRQIGTLLWFDIEKTFGFIALTDNVDVFLHASQVQSEHVSRLRPGSTIEFDLGRRAQGLCALNARVISPAS